VGEQLVAAIEATGYGAALPEANRSAIDEQEAQDAARTEEFHALRTKAIVAFIIGMVAMFAPMLLPMPQMTAAGALPAAAGFLRGLREVTRECGVLLVLDDDSAFRESLVALLESQGFEAVGVGSLETARAMILERSFDALLVDQELPDGSGLEAT